MENFFDLLRSFSASSAHETGTFDIHKSRGSVPTVGLLDSVRRTPKFHKLALHKRWRPSLRKGPTHDRVPMYLYLNNSTNSSNTSYNACIFEFARNISGRRLRSGVSAVLAKNSPSTSCTPKEGDSPGLTHKNFILRLHLGLF